MNKPVKVGLTSVLLALNCATYTSFALSNQSLVLEEVIVTANRREQNLQEVPMSVSAFGGKFFKDSGVTDLAGLEQYTPSLKITPNTDSRGTSVRIRGIGSVGTNSGIDPSVGIFIDGVYQGRAGMSISDLIDIERVEVLRGPQGTLYGKNTAAGALSIITKKPSSDFESTLELVYANDNRAEVRGMFNTPFGDSGHAMRVTGFLVNGDHKFNNTFNGDGLNDANKWGAKTRFLFDAGEGGDVLMTVDYSKEDTDCCALSAITYDGLSTLNAPITARRSEEFLAELGPVTTPGPRFGLPVFDFIALEDSEGFSPPAAAPFGDDYWLDSDTRNEVEVGGVALEWNRELGSENSLTFINAWRHYESDSAFDGDFTAYGAVQASTDVELDQYSSELRIASTSGQTLEYQAGVFAYYSEFDSVGTFNMGVPLVNNIGLGFFFPNGSLNTDVNLYTTTSFAGFGQLTWNVNEKWSATFGLRLTYEKKERVGSQITEGYFIDAPNNIIDIPPVAGPDILFDNKRSDSDLSPTINLRYFATQDLMVYASVSRGFKSGGFNQRREAAGSDGEFDEEIATNYELGWKGTWLDRRLQVNGSLYFVDYEDFQAQGFDGSSIKVTNAGSLESYGLELDIAYVVSENIDFGSAIGYNKAEYSEFPNGQCTIEQSFVDYYVTNGNVGLSPGFSNPPCLQDLGGKPLDNAPELTVSSYLQYEKLLSDDLLSVSRLEHNYTDSFFLDQYLDSNLENDATHLVNLRFSLRHLQKNWELALWGRNLLDEEYFVFGIDIPTIGGYAGIVAPETTFGVTFRRDFQ
ncbi:MAG: TonB-dependent receptor [Pseudomonadota bacterium]